MANIEKEWPWFKYTFSENPLETLLEEGLGREQMAKRILALEDAYCYLWVELRDILYNVDTATEYSFADYKSMILIGSNLERLRQLYHGGFDSAKELGFEGTNSHEEWDGWIFRRDRHLKEAIKRRAAYLKGLDAMEKDTRNGDY